MKYWWAGLALAVAVALWVAWLVYKPDDPPVEPSAKSSPWFEDVTARRGIDFVHDVGPTGAYFFPQIMGSGAAFLDFDKDGRLDIYLVQQAGPDSKSKNRLFRQLPNKTFEDVSAKSGLDVAGFGMGVAVGDVNNDGFPDVVLSEYGGVRLFENTQKGAFREVTESSGLIHSYWGTSACLFDYDRDGLLDLVVANYVKNNPSQVCRNATGSRDFCHPKSFPGSPLSLFHNESSADQVKFRDVSVEAKVTGKPEPGLGVVTGDFDGDGWLDILVANDSRPNHLWINKKNGTFREEALVRGLAYNKMGKPEANMGIGVGDIDHNGLFDVFITHLDRETNTLWMQEKAGIFRDQTVRSGLATGTWRGTGFGTVVADLDNNGHLDVAVVNGGIVSGPPANEKELGKFWSRYAQRNQLFAGLAGGKFRDVSEANSALCKSANVGRGLASADLDNDGRLELLVTTVAGRAKLLDNVVPKSGHWLTVVPVDPTHGGRIEYGSVVTVHAGKHTLTRWVNPGTSYLCSSDPRAHFGLGATKKIDQIHVVWPDGVEETFPGGNIDRVVTLERTKKPEAQPNE